MPTTTTDAGPGTLFDRDHRGATIGILLLVTLVAFEHMGVTTAMPTMVAELDGARLYSWPFTAFLATSVLGTVLSGRLCDARGPVSALLAGPLVFLLGLVVAGSATQMSWLLVGRCLQGFGAGTLVVAVYVLIALVYDERIRPAMFAANAAAWVVPALLGPTVSGLVTAWLSWRLVFLGLVPLVIVGVLLLAKVLRQLPSTEPAPREQRRKHVVPAAFAAAIGVTALTWATQHPSTGALVYGAVGVGLLAFAMRVLLPRGTLRAKPGLPTVVLARGLLAAGFATVEAFLPLTLSSVHGYSPAAAGIPLTIGALGWSAASYWQGRKPDLSRGQLLRIGFCLLAVGLAVCWFVAPVWGIAWLAIPGWLIAGAGMGLGMPSISVLLLALSAPTERGANTSAMQLMDWVSAALFIGLGGMLLGVLGSTAEPSRPMAVLLAAMVGLAVLGASLTGRRAWR
ncbi:putative MFS family arabinose efflux permease [Tamaricihabitans halophyticus]|uniref:Putative MFS family arabinose efflux permease n=1 Tax=Tamaricihabitans halophyticus TaxID=1262583 RepID=A0A4R2QQR4_9PSEU|nr:MFS transporter [Tamaricihabitans halophyticus]TCP52103.1 putative MFS family arabinose efflux permease [Tamaricihabitans halophyticus]